MSEVTDVERYLADVGRALMDGAILEKDCEVSNQMSRLGRMLTELNTAYGPKAEDFTWRDWETVEKFIADNKLTNSEAAQAYCNPGGRSVYPIWTVFNTETGEEDCSFENKSEAEFYKRQLQQDGSTWEVRAGTISA
jgi:hypothetical protein